LRGQFRPPLDTCDAWLTVNLSPRGEPTLIADAGRLPVAANSVDVVVCTEVLEHVAEPRLVVREIRRVLKPGGLVLGSTPFLYPVHADPYDYSRFTGQGVRDLLNGFDRVEVRPLGTKLGTIGMLIVLGAEGYRPTVARRLIRLFGRSLTELAMRRRKRGSSTLNTGYFWLGRAPDCPQNLQS
jgi:SAM-dependent methyltransferase